MALPSLPSDLSVINGVTTRYAYDAAGRMAREGNKTYRYGYLDKVMSMTDGDTTRTYTYHADGQLASANYVNNGRAGAPRTPQTESFLWDGLALIQRGDEQFVNEPHVGGGNPVASSKGTSYFNDALGTTVGSKSNGKYSAAALTAFGESLPADASNSQLTTHNSQTFFTGKPYVEGLGHAFWMRNYRAGLAKWQTADPMGYPDGWNALAYCGNGVADSVDLWGCKWVLVESYASETHRTAWKEVSRTAPSDSEILELLYEYGKAGWLKPKKVLVSCESLGETLSGDGEWHYLGKYRWWEKSWKETWGRVEAVQCVVTTKELVADPSLWNALRNLGCTALSKVPGPIGALMSIKLDIDSIEGDFAEIRACIEQYGKDTIWTIDFGTIYSQMEDWRVWGRREVWE